MATIRGGKMTIDIDKLKHYRDENFKKLGQYLLQKKYYEENIEVLLRYQEDLCNRILRMERDNDD
jgi:hypothetical protein